MSKPYHTYSFEKLEVWIVAREIRNEVYKLSHQFPDQEKFGVTSQIRRAANSISDNLAEGSGRSESSDRSHFTNMAYSSALEVLNHLITCNDQGYINEETYVALRSDMDKLINKLNAYYRHQLNKGGSVKDRFRGR